MSNQCEALTVVSPEATDEERACTHDAGEWIFDGYYGARRLCDQHAKSFKDAGFELRKSK
jgi:hypothetical protein